MPKQVSHTKKNTKTAPAVATEPPPMTPIQRKLMVEFAGIVQNMPSDRVQPLIDLFTKIRENEYRNVDLFEMLKRHTSFNETDSFAYAVKHLNTMAHIWEFGTRRVMESLRKVGQPAEDSAFDQIKHELECLTKGESNRGVPVPAFWSDPTKDVYFVAKPKDKN